MLAEWAIRLDNDTLPQDNCTEYRVTLTTVGWQVIGNGAPNEPFKKKLAAVRRARTLARRAESGQVVIIGVDGRCQHTQIYRKADYRR